MELKDLWKWLLALLGIGGVTVLATGAWGVPQSGVYSQLLPAPQWLYAGDTASCIWEVHPNTTKTINSVSYGAPGSWTACTQNSTDLLLWTCSSVTVAEGNVTCPGIRIVQNENPGTTETLDTENITFKTASVKGTRFPGCTSADCTITSGATIAAGNYFMRNLKIDAAMTFSGSTNITAAENFTIGSSGSITIAQGATPYTLNVSAYRFANHGTISGNGAAGSTSTACQNYGDGSCVEFNHAGGIGYDASHIIVSAYLVNNTGSITLVGGLGGPSVCCGSSSGPFYGSCCYAPPAGGKGGNLTIITVKPNIHNTGSISVIGGSGNTACYNTVGTPDCATAGGVGGAGGKYTLVSLNFTSSNTISANGGQGGNGAGGTGFSCTTDGSGGAATAQIVNVSGNISISASITASGGATGTGGCAAGSVGAAGSWAVSYCGNGTGMNWASFSPAATQSIITCQTPPTVSFVVPNATSNFTAYLQNVSVNTTRPDNVTLLISFSKDNGTTWEWLSPDFYSIPFNSSNNNTPSLDTHRQGSDNANYAIMRVIAYNNSSGIYGDPVEMRFNLTDMATTVVGTAVPNGSISTNTILFTCNYTNSSGSMVEAATPNLVLDGTSYSMTFNSTSLIYYWNNNQTLLAGSHWWRCSHNKANYFSALGTNTTFNITGFGIFLPTGVTTVKLQCPFPTISGMTPAGQKAGIGIFRIVNYNASATHNYSLFLNNSPPSGVTVYSRCDRYSPNLANWTALSTTTGYKGLLNIASTNTSAYCWLRMDCVSATPGTYSPIDYVFTEE